MQVYDICFLIDSITEARSIRIKVEMVAHMAHNIYIFHLSLSKEEKRQLYLWMLTEDTNTKMSTLKSKANDCSIFLFSPLSYTVEFLQCL